MPRLSKRRELIWPLFAAVAASYYVAQTVVAVLPRQGLRPSDFQVYYDASRALLMGQSPFRVAGYIYPPLLPFLLVPVTLLDFESAQLLWFWMSQACLLASGVLVWKATGGDRIATLVTVSIWSIGGAAYSNLALGQVNPFLLLLLSTAWYFHCRRSWVGAVGLGLAAAIKLWPSALLLTYAPSRDWKSMRVAVIAFLSLTAIPWMALAYFVPPPHAPALSKAWMGTPALFNFSFPAVALRILDPPVAGQRLPFNWEHGISLQDVRLLPNHAATSVGVGCLIYVLGVILLVWSTRGRTGRQVQMLWLAALTSLALVSSPVAWSHYQLLQYPGAAYLLASFLRQSRAGAAGFAAAVFLGLHPISCLGLDIYLRDYGWTDGNLPWLWFFSSLAPVCGLLLFGVCLRELRRGHFAASPEY